MHKSTMVYPKTLFQLKKAAILSRPVPALSRHAFAFLFSLHLNREFKNAGAPIKRLPGKPKVWVLI